MNAVADFRLRLQRSEQYLTLSQSRAHFFLQVYGRWQTSHVFCGNSDFFIVIQSIEETLAIGCNGDQLFIVHFA